MTVVGEAPVKHGEIFFPIGRCKEHEIRNAGEQRDVEMAKMRHIGHGSQRPPQHKKGGGIVVDAQILRNLVVGTLKEGTAHAKDGFSACLRHARRQSHGVFLGYADIDKLLACLLPTSGRPTPNTGSAGGDGANGFVVFHALQEVDGSEGIIVFPDVFLLQCAGGNLKGHGPVPSFFVLLSRRISLALQCVDVDDHGVVRVLHFAKSFYQGGEVVPFVHIDIVKPHGAEKIVLTAAMAAAKFGEVFVESAVVLGNGHLIVVHNDDEVGVQLRRPVETFQRLTATQRAVTNHSYHISGFTAKVTPLCQTAGKTDGRGGVTDDKKVVFALRGFGVAGDVIIV